MSSTTTFVLLLVAAAVLFAIPAWWMMYHLFEDGHPGRWAIALFVWWAAFSVGFGYLFWWLDVRWGISCPRCKEWGIQ